MNDVISTMTWCALQVSLLALIGVTIASLIARRSAPLACSVLFSAASTAAVLTVLAPLPIHSLFVVNAGRDSLEHDAAQSRSAQLSLSISDSKTAAATLESTAHLMFDPRGLLVGLQSVARRVEILEEQHRPIVYGSSLLLLAMISLGLLRLTAEVLHVLRTRRASMALDNAALLGEVNVAATNLGCRMVPDVRVHPEFSDAAIIGWFRPMLILPREWDEWTACEQRAVITHEIAHIVRHDAPWRMMASCVLAMHFYNPIVHWLLRRAVLYQELSTDQMAAEVMGRRDYLRSLSSLAIRRDDQWGRNVSPRILPVFSGHLIKRIKVLHSKEGIRAMNSRRGRTAASAVISAAFLVAGLAAIATRGIAQSPPDESKPKLTVQPVSTRGNLNISRPTTPRTANEMFHRQPLDPETVGSSNPYGMVVIRVRELFENPAMQPYRAALNDIFSSQFAAAAKLKTAPAINVDTIEWIAARPCFTTKSATDTTKSKVMFGAGGFIIKLNQPLDLNHWINQNAIEISKFTLECDQPSQTMDVYQFTSAVLGPVPIQFWMQDPLTIQISSKGTAITADTKLSDLDLSPKPPLSTSNVTITNFVPGATETNSWAEPWNRIDGGLFSVVMPKCDNSGALADFKNRADLQTESYRSIGRRYEELCALCLMTGISLDIARETPQVSIRVSMVHSSPESAAKSEGNLKALLELWQTELTEYLNRSGNEPDRMSSFVQVELMKSLFEAASYEINKVDDASTELRINASVPFAKLFAAAVVSDKVEKVD
ncbi:M56 family metallopeptidase [Schlesneria paludicola]|uniref:M56 family metallopeptidase n=1 Tax=Schlesneria paludicola TaxID=360056 RepID=UPI00029A331C|nr:M56 family metallopeptidase [Schlesneria paludicola]